MENILLKTFTEDELKELNLTPEEENALVQAEIVSNVAEKLPKTPEEYKRVFAVVKNAFQGVSTSDEFVTRYFEFAQKNPQELEMAVSMGLIDKLDLLAPVENQAVAGISKAEIESEKRKSKKDEIMKDTVEILKTLQSMSLDAIK